jgi:hypothetical protein
VKLDLTVIGCPGAQQQHFTAAARRISISHSALDVTAEEPSSNGAPAQTERREAAEPSRGELSPMRNALFDIHFDSRRHRLTRCLRPGANCCMRHLRAAVAGSD